MPPPTPVSARSAWPSGNAAPGEKIPPADGVVTLRSSHGPEETMKRLEAAVKAKGLYVFARVDHAASSTASEFPLRPTDLLIFGAAKVGLGEVREAAAQLFGKTRGHELWRRDLVEPRLGPFQLSRKAEQSRLVAERRAQHHSDRQARLAPMQRDRHAGLAGHVEELCERHELDQRLPIGVEIRIVRAQRPHRNRRLRKGRAEEEIVGLMERGHQPALPVDALQR